tara:strand:- start:172 stop:435 length:264 start_codon:yes stop_codon:yes gene_type:complete
LAKHKKSRREKLRGDAPNDCFTRLGAQLDPNRTGPLKSDKATILIEAAGVIKLLREELGYLHNKIVTLEVKKAREELTKVSASLEKR